MAKKDIEQPQQTMEDYLLAQLNEEVILKDGTQLKAADGHVMTKQGVPKKRQPVPCNPAFQNYVESINGEPYKYVEEKI